MDPALIQLPEKPCFTDTQLQGLLRQLYSIDDAIVTPLDSYDDQVCLVKARGQQWVLKIGNECESREYGAVKAAHIAVMQHLHDNGVPSCTAVPLLCAENKRFARVDERLGMVLDSAPFAHFIHLLTFLPGVAVQSIDAVTPPLLRRVGALVGRIDALLRDFHHEAFIANPLPSFWSVERCTEVRPLLHAIDKAERRSLIADVLDRFQHAFSHHPPRTRSIVHGDLSDTNILVDPAGETIITGVIDFGDCHWSFSVLDIVITISHMMSVRNRLDTGGHVLAGYLLENRLEEDEWRVLKVCVEARLAQSIAIGSYTARFLQPENTYIMDTLESGWQALALLHGVSESEAIKQWRRTISEHEKRRGDAR